MKQDKLTLDICRFYTVFLPDLWADIEIRELFRIIHALHMGSIHVLVIVVVVVVVVFFLLIVFSEIRLLKPTFQVFFVTVKQKVVIILVICRRRADQLIVSTSNLYGFRPAEDN
jgi:hypothetical protein